MNIKFLTDMELMECVANKNTVGMESHGMDALGEIYNRYNDSMRIFLLLGKHANTSNVDDIIQLTWTRMVEMDGDKYTQSKGEFSTWLFTIAVRIASNFYIHLRRAKRGGQIHHHKLNDLRDKKDDPMSDLRIGSTPSGPVADAISKERCQRVRDAIGQLPKKYQEAIRLVFLEDQSIRKAATNSGLSVNSIVYRCQQAKRLMAIRLAHI